MPLGATLPLSGRRLKSGVQEFKNAFMNALGQVVATSPIGMGLTATNYLGDLYDEYVPSDVRRNIKDMVDAPIPGNPLLAGKGIITGADVALEALPALKTAAAIPFILKNLGRTKSADELAARLATRYNIKLTEPYPLVRAQQESVDFPVTRGRLPIFASYGTNYGGYANPVGAAEGGPHRVQFDYESKNPLLLFRGKDLEFIGPQTITKLAGKTIATQTGTPAKAALGGKYNYLQESPINELYGEYQDLSHAMNNYLVPEYPNVKYNYKEFRKRYPRLSSVLNKKDILNSLSARDPVSALSENLATRLAQRQGFTSINTFRKAKIRVLQILNQPNNTIPPK